MKILFVFGTRPEAIKMCPLVNTFLLENNIDTKVCVTGQHREILDQVLNLFNVKQDYDLNIMKRGQTLENITSSIIKELKKILTEFNPDLVLVHGDTSTTFATALCCYYNKIKVGHIEAGLRTGDKYSPWPEEMNRKLTSSIADLHFCPTDQSKDNLLKENISKKSVFVCGNTVIDALFYICNFINNNEFQKEKLHKKYPYLSDNKKTILVTCHRRENFGNGIISLCSILKKIISKFQNIQIILPVHPNPNVKNILIENLSGINSIKLIEPLDYMPFVFHMMISKLILTDSGGIQEEAPSLGKPVLVLRENTERPEAVESGTVKLVSMNEPIIINELKKLLSDDSYYKKFSSIKNPYGDGKACLKIKKIIKRKYLK